MTWRVARSLDTLANEVNARWPGRSKISDGTLGDQAHAARVSDHNPDAAGIVRARDITAWDPDGDGPQDAIAETIAETLRANRDPRVKYVIWRGRMFASYSNASRKAWEWGPYTGSNGHFHHVHVSVVPDARADGTAPWGIYPTAGTPAPPEEFTMDKEAEKRFDRLEAAVKALTEYVKGKPDGKGKTRLERIGEDTNATRAAVGRLEGKG